MCHASGWQRFRCIFILFFHIQIFFWFNFRYEAKLIGKSSSSVLIAEIKNRPVVFTSTFQGKNPRTHQTRRRTFNYSRANLNGPIRNTLIFFCRNPSLQGSPEHLICAEELWVEIEQSGRHIQRQIPQQSQ